MRYLTFAGGVYTYFWIWHKNESQLRHLQGKPFRLDDMRREIRYSLLAALLFAGIEAWPVTSWWFGGSAIYTDWRDHGVAWLVVSLPLLILFHDAYFYWMHRLIHHPKLFARVHHVHHQSRNPSPFAMYSFHPWEAAAEFLWSIPVLYFVPLHVGVLGLFAIVTLSVNVMAHSGLEFYPEHWKTHRVLKFLNYSKYHSDHHRGVRGNYGFYFTFWDRWMGTLIEPRKTVEAFDS